MTRVMSERDLQDEEESEEIDESKESDEDEATEETEDSDDSEEEESSSVGADEELDAISTASLDTPEETPTLDLSSEDLAKR